MTTRNTLLALAGLITCATLAGACAVADPDTSQSVLRYSGGWFSNQGFEECIPPGVRDVASLGTQHYYYPAGQRTFTFSDAPGADAPPLLVSTNNQIKLTVRGTITVRLNNSCAPYDEYKTVAGKQILERHWDGGLFQRFHDTIGRHNVAFATNAEIENNQAAGLRSATADTDRTAAERFPGGIQGYLEYQQKLAVNDAIKTGKVRVIPIPQGSSVIVPGS